MKTRLLLLAVAAVFGVPLAAHATMAIQVAAAPEIDPAAAAGAMTLLLGGLAVVRGRRRKN